MACLSRTSKTDCVSSSSHRWSPFLGGGSAGLDSNTLKLIHCIYCQECRMEKIVASGVTEHHHHHHVQSQGVTLTSGSAGSTNSSSQTPLVGMPLAPPRTPPDQASIQTSMDKNKETLKRKLMLRRSVNELVDRGIYPPLKTPPAFAEKTKQLERAKTGDLLRHKIQQRPDRQLLVQQHILEDTTIDPSLHERQRLLKRSRLLDGLNGKLAHRPGPLELVQGNILQPSHELADAIKDGTIQFVPTCDTEDMDQSSSSFVFDDESTGSDGTPSPSMDESSGFSDVSSPSSAPPVPSSESVPISFTFTKSMPIPLSVKSPQIPVVSANNANSAIITASSSTPKLTSTHPGTSIGVSALSSSHINIGTAKSRTKKPKPKALSKAKIIKFHEYKGPPSVVKSQSSNSLVSSAGSSSVEDTPYHILLQQQQLFLQWQLEFQQKQQQGTVVVSENAATSPTVSPVIVTSPVVTTTSAAQMQSALAANNYLAQTVTMHKPQTSAASIVTQNAFSPVSMTTSAQITTTPQSSPVPPPPPPPPLPPTRPTQSVAPRQASKALTSIPASALSLPKLTTNLEEMKVADLKAELKKRSLPVSGPKPQLIERLKPFTESCGGKPASSVIAPPKSNNSRSPSCVSTPLQFSQTTFHIKTEPNGEVTACPVTRPIPSTTATSLLNSSSPTSAGSHASTFSMPVTLPFGMQGIKTVVSVKPMVKEEPMTTTDISPPSSPPTLQASTPIPTPPMSPEYEATSPPSLTPKLTLSAPLISQSLVKSGSLTGNQLLQNNQTVNSLNHGQTVLSMNTDVSQSASVVPAEMMPMEVDPVSIDLNQGVDDTAFKAASLGHSLDSANFKALVQHPVTAAGYKTAGVCQSPQDSNPIKTVSIDTNSMLDANSIKTINLSPNFDTAVTVKTINICPSTDPATIKTINLGSSADGMALKTLNLSPGADATGFQTISLSPVRDATSLLKTVKVPLSQLSPTQMSPVQIAAPLTRALSSPASLLPLQQLQTLHHLQQQLLQQTQLNHFQQQTQQQPSQSVQLSSNDQVVLAQAKQIEELQRQLQESHLKLKLQQLQQQHLQLQQHQQKQLWQVQIPTNFAQNSLLTKLSQEQLTISPQNGQVLTAPLQLQQQPAQVMLQPTASVVQQQQPASIFLNSHSNQHAPQAVSGMHQTQVHLQQHQAPVMLSNQNAVSNNSSIGGADDSATCTVTSDSSLLNMAGLASNQIAGGTNSQTAVSLPYAIHINLTNSGQVKLPAQLQTISSSAAAAVTNATKSSALPPLQLPTPLLFTPTSTSILGSQQIKSEPSTPKAMGLPATTSVANSQVASAQPYVFTATPSSTVLVPGHTNGVISRTPSVPITSMTTEDQKLNAQHCSSNPFFNGPMKEPPRYDEAIKIKQQQIIPHGNKILASSTTCLNKPLSLGHIHPEIKSQTMDDVLEILIRNGDLPPSAATGALSTSRLAQVMELPQTSSDTATVASPPCLSATSIMPSATSVAVQNQSVTSPHQVQTGNTSVRIMGNCFEPNSYPSSTSSSSPRDQTLTSVHTSTFADSLLSDSSSPHNLDASCSSSVNLNDANSHSDEGELLDWGEMLHSPDLCSMDWSTESSFGHLDLGDSNLNLDSKMCDNLQPNRSQTSNEARFSGTLSRDPMCSSSGFRSDCLNNNVYRKNSTGLRTPSVHESEPDLISFGLGGDTNESLDPTGQMDMTEWLDVIMPNNNINLECMNTHTTMPYSADPILTPRTQQEVFDIFNFDDSDFSSSVMSWDKMTEQGTSSS